MNTLNYLNDWGTAEKFVVYPLAAYGFMTALRRPLEDLIKLIDAIRHPNIGWMLSRMNAFRIWLQRGPTLKDRIAAEERSPRSALNGAIGTASLYYLLSGLLSSLWLFYMTEAIVDMDRLPGWKLYGFMIAATALFCPFAGYYKRLAHKERIEAHRLWKKYPAQGFIQYTSLATAPVLLIALAIAVSALRMLSSS